MKFHKLLLIFFILKFISNKLKRVNLVDKEIETLKNTIKDEIFQQNLNSPLNLKRMKLFIEKKLLDFDIQSEEKKRLNVIKNHWKKGNDQESFVAGEDPQLQRDDEKSTEKILNLLKREYKQKFGSLIEFAAGVGRVIKRVFVNYFDSIDAVEPAVPLAKKIEELKNDKSSLGKIRKIYTKGGMEFQFEKKYDLIFGQWYLENLTDIDIIRFLILARENLNKNGRIFFKENGFSSEETNSWDTAKGQKIRPRKALAFLFNLCGFRIGMLKISDNYPSNKVMLYEFLLEKDD